MSDGCRDFRDPELCSSAPFILPLMRSRFSLDTEVFMGKTMTLDGIWLMGRPIEDQECLYGFFLLNKPVTVLHTLHTFTKTTINNQDQRVRRFKAICTRHRAVLSPFTSHQEVGVSTILIYIQKQLRLWAPPTPAPPIVTLGLDFDKTQSLKPISFAFPSVSHSFYWNNYNFLARTLTYIKSLRDGFAGRWGWRLHWWCVDTSMTPAVCSRFSL